MGWTASEENVAKDVYMQLNDAYLKDFKNGLNLMIFEIQIILKSYLRESLQIPILING
jgi:hypothetical protein